jgi:hypothetical protein
MAVKMLIVVFWDITLCSLVGGYQYLRGTYCLHLQSTSTLNMDTVHSSKMLVTTYKTT